MKVKVKVIIACLLTILAARFAYAKDIHVPGDYDTIQEAIDAAVPDDRVIVAAGTYEENITLKSFVDILGAGADVTTITASSGNVVSADGITAKLNGFTIDGRGSADGIYIDLFSSITISNNVITQNNTGVDCFSSSATVSNNIITQNNTGIECFDSSATISSNIITQNSFGGVSCLSAAAETIIISDNTITQNGYGVYCDFASPTVRGNIITDNWMDGIYIFSANPDIGTEAEPGMNAIYDNGGYDVNNQTDNTIMAEMNWWGKAPPDAGQFLGDVDYEPWLEEPPPPIQGAINGYVTDADTGEPIKWAFVIAIQKPTKKWTLAKPDGYYELAGLPPGDWWVIVIQKGYKVGIAKVVVNASQTTTKDFQLKPKTE